MAELMARREQPLTGTMFIESVRGLPRDQVEARILEEVVRGNIPSFMSRAAFRPVTVSAVVDGRQVTATFRASQDYIAIGTDRDFVRMPMSPILARRIAQQLGCVLPAFRMVDAIDEESRRQGGYQSFYAAPAIAARVTDPDTGRPLRWDPNHPSGRWIMSPTFASVQSRMVDTDIGSSDHPGALRSGHKKDIVYHPEAQRRGNVAIYHRGIQGLNYVSHDNSYADYSHGARLIDPSVSVVIREADGSERTEALQLGDMLSGRGQPPYNHLYRLFSEVPMDISAIYPPPSPRAAAQPPAARASPRRQAVPLRRPVIRLDEIDQ